MIIEIHGDGPSPAHGHRGSGRDDAHFHLLFSASLYNKSIGKVKAL